MKREAARERRNRKRRGIINENEKGEAGGRMLRKEKDKAKDTKEEELRTKALEKYRKRQNTRKSSNVLFLPFSSFSFFFIFFSPRLNVTNSYMWDLSPARQGWAPVNGWNLPPRLGAEWSNYGMDSFVVFGGWNGTFTLTFGWQGTFFNNTLGAPLIHKQPKTQRGKWAIMANKWKKKK